MLSDDNSDEHEVMGIVMCFTSMIDGNNDDDCLDIINDNMNDVQQA